MNHSTWPTSFVLGTIIETTMRKLLFFAVLAACLTGGPVLAENAVTLMAHDSFSATQDTVSKFESQHGLKLRFLKSGDAGAALNKAILSKNNPLADVFFGVDNTFLSRALRADIFEPYASELLADIPDALKLDSGNRLLPADFGDVCLNYDKKWFADKALAPPKTLEDLIRPEYANLTVVENPATSSPGLAFMLTTIGHFGTDGWLDYWKKLRTNGVLVVNGWNEAYWGRFTAASKGDRPIVVSYATSPAAEVHYSKTPLDDSPTAAVVSDGTAFRQIEFVGILKGTKNREGARKLVDFILGKTFQEDIPLQMFVFPANKTATLPAVFTTHSKTAEKPVALAPDAISENREKWIGDWTETVLR